MKFKRLEVYEHVMFDEAHFIPDSYMQIPDEDNDVLVLLATFENVEITAITDEGTVATCNGKQVAVLKGDGIMSVDVFDDYIRFSGRPIIPPPEIMTEIEYPYVAWRAYMN